MTDSQGNSQLVSVTEEEAIRIAGEQDILGQYHENPCPAELLIPYRLSAKPNENALQTFMDSRFKVSLWNMDSPLIIAIKWLIRAQLVFILGVWLYSLLEPSIFMLRAGLVGTIPLSLLLFPGVIYAAIVLVNLRTTSDEHWKDSLLGPTHIGLTDSGFKLWWRGKYIYNFPSLALWSEIFEIDVVADAKYTSPCLKYIYQSGFGRREINLPFIGLQTAEDTKIILDYFARFVPIEHQSERFKAIAHDSLDNVWHHLEQQEDRQLGMTNELEQK